MKNNWGSALFPLAILLTLSGLTFWLVHATELPEERRDGKNRHDPDYIIEQTKLRKLDTTGRLQWRNEQGMSAVLQPLLIHSEGENRNEGTQTDIIGDPANPLGFSRSQTQGNGRFTMLRLNGQFNHSLGTNARLEWRFGLGNGHWRNTSVRDEFDTADAPSRRVDDRTDNRDRNATLSLKATGTLEGGHSLVGGIELERNRRVEGRTTLWDGVPQLTEFGDNLTASSRRYALYAQDEWSITPQWAAHAGLRVEGITTEGEGANNAIERNHSRVARRAIFSENFQCINRGRRSNTSIRVRAVTKSRDRSRNVSSVTTFVDWIFIWQRNLAIHTS